MHKMAHSVKLLAIMLLLVGTLTHPMRAQISGKGLKNMRHGFPPDRLHVNMDEEMREIRTNSVQFYQHDEESGGISDVDEGEFLQRIRRDAATTATPPNNATTTTAVSEDDENKIATKIYALKDNHAQLMVHWLGEGTNVMICLAREPPSSAEDGKSAPPPTPSAVFISFDYGDTFLNKTDLFRLDVNGTMVNATLDQFTTHSKFSTIVFTDPRNKAIFTSSDLGRTVQNHQLDFTPSDVSFYEADPYSFLVLDKEDPERKLYLTTDFGKSFIMLQSYVKSFVWSPGSGDGMPIHLYVERKSRATNSSSVIFINASSLMVESQKKKFNLLIENVQDFHVKRDFMFATRKVIANMQLFISHKRGRFIKGEFQTELEVQGLHIADVEGLRIFVSAVHSEAIAHLYVSEIDQNVTEIKFVPSLENVFTFIPDLTWKNSWLVPASEDAFTELYKVEGLRGIYIASKVGQPTPWPSKMSRAIGHEHLSSVITFDHGSSWRPITAPTVDDEGQLINCTKDCSLHVSQKFSQLYPVTRSPTILSSKSAPGVIMASGTVGKSLKGHPGVFISRDAGLTWKQILKNYHFFNLGDHGGVLVAVKYFKSKGETREILYSTDEGEKWNKLDVHSKDLKVYGLMTEPNTNTSIFTVFGSEVEQHQWLIIKVDLKKAFSYNCTEHDYKFWAPGSQTGDSLMPCLMGEQTTYHRRIPHSNCYNGMDYARPVRTEKCLCNLWDFECDFGFSRKNLNAPCIRNKSLTNFDPYKVPETCSIGAYYKRTKGYRKIDGDVCYGGYSAQYLPQSIPCPINETNNFLIVAQREKISRIDLLSGNRTELPVSDLRNVIAIEFDLKNNCVFYADVLSDTIGRQCFNGNQSREILVDSDLASVEGMSYDWVSELLFFVDGHRFKIEALKTSRDHFSRMRKTILDDKVLSKPRGIAVHPIEGYLFWTDWSSKHPSLSRSNLDGTEIRSLFSEPQVVWPNGVTIDFIAERVYWVDASKDYIASCDLQGRGFKRVLENDPRVTHPFAVGVYKDLMYWDDWKMNSVFVADKDSGIMVQTVINNMNNLMDMKVYAHSIQEGSNACGKKLCTHICVGAPRNGYTCLCPDGMERGSNGECLCPGGQTPYANKTCPQQANTCASGYFTCANNLCIPNLYLCDGENDCGDNSDEEKCAITTQACPPHMFTCVSDGMCIPEYFACDHERDCNDGSDELSSSCNFKPCNENEFQCKNSRCIFQKWVCDDEDDCRDGSDEANCTSKVTTPHKCHDEEFRCNSTGTCIPKQWRCDTDVDCPDRTDELFCNQTTCDTWMFECGDGNCIYKTWTCDGDKDCPNGKDEENCKVPPSNARPTEPPSAPNGQCHDWMFKCANSKCVPDWWKCDGVNDCGDNSDEMGCKNSTAPLTTPKPMTEKPKTDKCKQYQFHCDSGECISKRFVCDGTPDCANGEDERGCPSESKKKCGPGKFRCISDGFCLPIEKYCDKVKNCVDNSDEMYCEHHWQNQTANVPVSCKAGMFYCDNTCLPLSVLCNNKMDCQDGMDESNCNSTSRIYQVVYIGIDERALNATNFLMYWWIPVPQNVIFEFLPSIALINTNEWRNHTEWINSTEHRILGLRPYTTYNLTVYVRVKDTQFVYPPYLYVNVTTAEGIPSTPFNVSVTQLNGSKVQVSWTPPKNTSGVLTAYTVYYSAVGTNAAPPQPQSIRKGADETSAIISSVFHGNTSYQFWVRARNSRYESSNSQLVKLLFDDATNIDDLKNLHIVSAAQDKITISWQAIQIADGYVVQQVLPQPYPRLEAVKTNSTNLTMTLIPGVRNEIKVSAFVKSIFGKSDSLYAFGKGEPLPEVPSVILDEKSESYIVVLHWTKPKFTSNKVPEEVTYGVFYGTTVDELMDKPRIITKNLSAQISDLMPCESYLISVSIWEPLGPGPLGRDPKRVDTQYNEKKPPKNLKVTFNGNRHEMTISWEHSCPFVKVQSGYVITITEMSLNKTSRVELRTTFNRTLLHTFTEIPFGASYSISVATNIKEAISTSVTAFSPPLPMPKQLKVWPEKNGSYVVYWKEIQDFNAESFTYILSVYPGMEINQTSVPIVTLESKIPPIIVNPEHLGKEAAGQVFTMAIRTKSYRGFVSNIAEIEHIEPQPDAWFAKVMPSQSSVWLIVVPVLIVISAAAVVYLLVQRQRRQQSSFSRFANSHYDTKTGATRIGTDALEDLDEHHESTPRFADDEPLVIA